MEWQRMEWQSIPGLVRWAAARFGDTEAVVDGRVRVSYRELGERVEQAAAACGAAGVRGRGWGGGGCRGCPSWRRWWCWRRTRRWGFGRGRSSWWVGRRWG